MPRKLEDFGRPFKRFRHSPEEKFVLAKQGFQHVLSSNVSAVAKSGKDLIIRFHNGSIYSYTGSADLYEKLLKSNSKGTFVWKNLRKPNKPFKKIGSLPLPKDMELDDEELFSDLDTKANRLGDLVGKTIIGDVIDKATGLRFRKFSIGGLILRAIVK